MPRFFLVPVLLVALTACRERNLLPTEPGDPQLPSSVTVAGTIRDYHSRAPVAGVTFTLGPVQLTTDANGRYSTTLPRGGHNAYFENTGLGSVLALTSRDDADLLINGGSCRSRYGNVVDALTGRPIAGATINLGGMHTTAADGSYRIDMSCSLEHDSGTGFIRITHPDYRDGSSAYRMEYLAPPQRLDIALTRK